MTSTATDKRRTADSRAREEQNEELRIDQAVDGGLGLSSWSVEEGEEKEMV